MAEIFRNAVNKGLEFSIPASVATVSDVTITRGDEVFNPTHSVVSGKTVVSLPFSLTKYDGKFNVNYTFTAEAEEHEVSETHEVVTPLFTPEELKAFDSDFNTITDASINSLERLIRSLFQTLTGQSFGLSKETVGVMGTGSRSLALPKRSSSPTGPQVGDGASEGPYATVTNDGWVVSGLESSSWIDKFEPWRAYSSKNFENGRVYYFSGTWGYNSVPSDIQLAAMTLAQDYGCDTSVWRERYTKTLTFADSRYEFSPMAFIKTGNVNVDQILDRFCLVRMVIL